MADKKNIEVVVEDSWDEKAKEAISTLSAQIEKLQLELKEMKGSEGGAEGGKGKKKKNFKLKTPKGMRDYGPEKMYIRNKVFNTIVECFKLHGAVTIDTPVMELKDVLMGKYGEDSKLIYELADQGGEDLALRYDLTVPFARFVAQNRIKQIKRYHIARVYRRDNPKMDKGRYREFYQCDIDFAGDFGAKMVPDAECVKIVCTILKSLDLGDFLVKVNNRKLLDGIFAVCGVPEEKFRTICSAVDKLDKMSWEAVKKEMTLEKGLDDAVADRIGEFVLDKGGEGRDFTMTSFELVAKLKANEEFMANTLGREGVEEIELLLEFMDVFKVQGNVSFDLSLARGLDYYTGVIYEAILVGQEVGSVAGGGRYDNLVGMFDKKGRTVPCVGVSLGVERLFAIIEEREREVTAENMRTHDTHVLVAAIKEVDEETKETKSTIKDRLALCQMMWAFGISTETAYKPSTNLKSEFKAAEDNHIPIMLIIGPDELKKGVVKVRNTVSREEEEVVREDVPEKVKALLASM
eukprot:m.82296 g.82296  ORF g.82296 m.82296 type:complete len:521 (-) comp8665_c4_seq1:3323-4885(-)